MTTGCNYIYCSKCGKVLICLDKKDNICNKCDNVMKYKPKKLKK